MQQNLIGDGRSQQKIKKELVFSAPATSLAERGKVGKE